MHGLFFGLLRAVLPTENERVIRCVTPTGTKITTHCVPSTRDRHHKTLLVCLSAGSKQLKGGTILIRTGMLWLVMVLSACAYLPMTLEEPQVKVIGLRLLPTQGMEQRIAVRLAVTNPNSQDLSVKGISYNIGIENIEVPSGATSQVPVLKAYEETPVTVEVTANLISVARLVQHFSRREASDVVSYRFQAKLDFSRWLPAMRVEERGEARLQY